jgi:hypothetical protein
MFGHDDNAQLTQDATPQGATVDGTLGAPATSAPDGGATVVDTSVPTSGYSAGGFAPVEPTEPVEVASETVSAGATPTPAAPVAAVPAASLAAPSDDDLLQIKQQALQQLSPLVGHLDQSAEEKFRTTMMMIQASDNQGLIKEAYAAAQEIEDEKTRAQALLDIVNEINYFTQHQAQ